MFCFNVSGIIIAIVVILILPVTAFSEPMTKEQGDAVLNELRQIRQLLQRPAQQQVPAPDMTATVNVAGMPILGNTDAPMTLVMFTDYQCSFCSRFERQTLPEIKKKYIHTGKLRFVVQDMPLSFHPNAFKAAEATHCAGEQGKYWELRDKLAANEARLDAKLLPDYARQVGLDLPKFSSCLESGRHAEKVRAGATLAGSIGISGTPSFVLGRSKGDIVEGLKIVGAQPFAVFDQKMKELLKPFAK